MAPLTKKEFKELVKEQMMETLSAFGEKAVDEYLNTDEAKQELETNYNKAASRFKNGQLSDEGFRKGIVGSTAWCLTLMFE